MAVHIYLCILIDIGLKVKIGKNNNKFHEIFLEIYLTLKSQNGQTRFQNLTANDFESNNKSRICKTLPSHPNCTWVKNFDPLTLSAKKHKIELHWGFNQGVLIFWQ